ncbi:copper-binding protein [Sutterella wadsworthensis]|uniref:copper-binding protein n=1 Tax=Sutterella wadsworthensis TaxID=40545 RepID=UPI0039670B6E
MIRTFAALAALLTVGAVQAADMNMDMSGHDHHMMMGDHSMHMAAQSPAVQAVGVVKAVDAASGKVTIEHEPIAALQWPAMTMRFTFKDPKLVEGLKAGDKIHFTFTQEGQLSVLQSIER